VTTKILEANGKPVYAIVPYDEYIALRELAEDAGDAATLLEFARRRGKTAEPTVPVEVADRLLAGVPPLRVWREFRGMTARELAGKVGVTPAHVSKIESGKGDPSLGLLRALAGVLAVDVDLLVGR